MFLVFYIIDQINPEMEFISSDISKFVLLLFCLCAFFQAVLSLVAIRMEERQLMERQHKRRPTQAQQRDNLRQRDLF